MIAAVDTAVEPPPFDESALLHGSEVEVTVLITENDGTRRIASTVVPTPGDARLAAALIECLRGAAMMRGPGLVDAIESWLR